MKKYSYRLLWGWLHKFRKNLSLDKKKEDVFPWRIMNQKNVIRCIKPVKTGL